MNDGSTAGLARDVGSCLCPPFCCPLPLPPPPAGGHGPGSGVCLCPALPSAHPLPWAGPSCVLVTAGHLPQEELPTLRPALGAHSSSPPRADLRRQMRDPSVGNGGAATSKHRARAAVPGRRQGTATDEGLSQTQAPCNPSLPQHHPYLASISTSPRRPVCPAAAHRPLRAPASGCRRLAVLSPFANMLLSPLVPQNQCR